MSQGDLLPAAEVVGELAAAGMTAKVIRKPTHKERFRDQSTVIVCPTKGKIDFQVVDSWINLSRPMNAERRGPIYALEGVDYKVPEKDWSSREGPWIAEGYKVDAAYNALVEAILSSPGVKNHRYLMTVEDDNILPWNAQLRLLESLEAGPDKDGSSEWDAVSALYHVKDPVFHAPMAYGDVEEFRRTGKPHFHPIDLLGIKGVVEDADGRPDLSGVEPEDQVVEVLGVGMGCCLWKMELFREIDPPWFVTLTDEKWAGSKATTQDLYFSNKVILKGKRIAVDLGCYVGHKDVNGDGSVY